MWREMLRAALAAAALLGAAALPRAAWAQVQAELVAITPTVAPGGTAQLALRLKQKPLWHTFWGVYPGIGLPTELAWQLPDGWAAEPIEWPTPQVLRDRNGKAIGHGYTGDVLLPVKLHVPPETAVGARVPVAARASWLMCREMLCIIGRQSVGTVLQVAAQAGPPDAALSAALARMPMPRTPGPPWKLAATLQGQAYTLYIKPPNGARELHFFPADRRVPYAPRQLLQAVGGSLTLRLPAMTGPATAEPARTHLRGVLRYINHDTQEPRGVQIDLPLTTPLAAAEAVGASATDTQNEAPTAAALPLAFASGVLLNLMPGVLPLLGWHLPLLWRLAQPQGATRRRLAAYGGAYLLGAAAVAALLTARLAALQAAGVEVLWGMPQRSLPWLAAVAGALLLVCVHAAAPKRLALPVWVPLPARGFVGGLLAAAAAAVAAGPFFQPALGIVSMVPLWQAGAVLAAAALGLALPVWLPALLPGLLAATEPTPRVRRLARSGLALMALAAAAVLAWRISAVLAGP